METLQLRFLNPYLINESFQSLITFKMSAPLVDFESENVLKAKRDERRKAREIILDKVMRQIFRDYSEVICNQNKNSLKML